MEITNGQIQDAVEELLMRIEARDNDPRIYNRYVAFWQNQGRCILQRIADRQGSSREHLVRGMIYSLNRVSMANGRDPVYEGI
jgi:hypothetical protein